jgi:hypothetical protein
MLHIIGQQFKPGVGSVERDTKAMTKFIESIADVCDEWEEFRSAVKKMTSGNTFDNYFKLLHAEILKNKNRRCEWKYKAIRSKSDWGPQFWELYHEIFKLFQKGTQQGRKDFIQNLPFTLPCGDCKDHCLEVFTNTYRIYDEDGVELDKITLSAESTDQFFFKFHNVVNERLNKKIFVDHISGSTMTSDTLQRIWKEYKILIIVGGIATIIGGVMYYRSRKNDHGNRSLFG